MDITPAIPKGRKIIKGYGAGSFKINGEQYNHSILLLPDAVIEWESAEITPDLYKHFRNKNIDILLLGCGEEHQMLPAEVLRVFRENNINVEIMTTGAACRTYNVLLGEERNVAAALILV